MNASYILNYTNFVGLQVQGKTGSALHETRAIAAFLKLGPLI